MKQPVLYSILKHLKLFQIYKQNVLNVIKYFRVCKIREGCYIFLLFKYNRRKYSQESYYDFQNFRSPSDLYFQWS